MDNKQYGYYTERKKTQIVRYHRHHSVSSSYVKMNGANAIKSSMTFC